jgi:hypothetical protein
LYALPIALPIAFPISDFAHADHDFAAALHGIQSIPEQVGDNLTDISLEHYNLLLRKIL